MFSQRYCITRLREAYEGEDLRHDERALEILIPRYRVIPYRTSHLRTYDERFIIVITHRRRRIDDRKDPRYYRSAFPSVHREIATWVGLFAVNSRKPNLRYESPRILSGDKTGREGRVIRDGDEG